MGGSILALAAEQMVVKTKLEGILGEIAAAATLAAAVGILIVIFLLIREAYRLF